MSTSIIGDKALTPKSVRASGDGDGGGSGEEAVTN